MRPVAAVLALAGLALGAPTVENNDGLMTLGERDLEARQSVIGSWRYCSSVTSICYNSYQTNGQSVYRIAIPEDASGSSYDIAIQLVAPRNFGWVALSFGGSMVASPIAVAWQNGGTCEVSSRWTDDRTIPLPYSSATFLVLSDTTVNATHWTLSAVCRGCSSWSRSSGSKTLNPGSSGVRVAWAQNTNSAAVRQPSNPNSSFDMHNSFNYFDMDLNGARNSNATWSSALAKVRPGGAANTAPPPSAITNTPPPVQSQPCVPTWPFWTC